jgi:hypothetical protein
MHRSKKTRIKDGQLYVAESLKRFLEDKAELVYENPSVYTFDFNQKDRNAIQQTNVVERILAELETNCPIFTNLTSGNFVHLHNFGTSLISKYGGEYFIQKVAFADRRALMEWARTHCEILDTRTSEFQGRSAETYNLNNFTNVIPLKF